MVVGDHGFGNNKQITEMDLGRFNVPLLLIGPGIQEKFGPRNHTVGTQIDIVPTIMGRLGGEVRHQCWGRDLLNLPAGDTGFGVIKPSGSEQTVALITGDRIFVEPKELAPRVYRYELGANPKAELIQGETDEAALKLKLEAFIQTATKSLIDNTAGVVHGTPE
ncbi:Sulfatase [compost metagenome]